jgi:hypothetical protein
MDSLVLLLVEHTRLFDSHGRGVSPPPKTTAFITCSVIKNRYQQTEDLVRVVVGMRYLSNRDFSVV